MPRPGESSEPGWIGHPWVARGIRLLAYLIPVAASVSVALLLSAHLPAPAEPLVAVLRWVFVAAVSTIALVAFEHFSRRLLPLSTLFKLTLAFPDRVPSRFRIAIRIGTTAQLRRKLQAARRGELGDTPGEVAERLLELVALLSRHDRMTRGHSERVRAYTHMIGAELGLEGRELDRVRWAGLLHDIGKLTIPGAILNKTSSLTADEYDIIRTHPMAGKALVEPLADWLGDSVRAVWEHHERFDGGGYPQGLAGTDIALASRVVCVADAFDVMTSARSYKRPLSPSLARQELSRCSGTQFDPVVVRAFMNVSIGRLQSTTGPLSWLTQLSLFPRTFLTHAGAAFAAGTAFGVGAVAGSVGLAVAGAPATPPRPAAVVVADDAAPNDDLGEDDADAAGERAAGAVPDGGTVDPDSAPASLPEDPATVTTDPGSGPPSAPDAPSTTDPVPPPSTLPPGPTIPVPTLPGTPTTVPTVSVPVTTPGITVPGITVPGVTVPGVTLPGVTVPVISTPVISLPGVSIPDVSTPPVTLGPVTVPPITLPPVTVPPVTVPSVTTPPVTVPPVTVPPVTVPPVTVAPVTLPPVTVPPVTVPPTTLPPVTVPPTTLPPVTVPSLPGWPL